VLTDFSAFIAVADQPFVMLAYGLAQLAEPVHGVRVGFSSKQQVRLSSSRRSLASTL
jgi:hypothetical protein